MAVLNLTRRSARPTEAAQTGPAPASSTDRAPAPEELSEAALFDLVLAEVTPALENLGENAMIADSRLVLRYLNPAALATLEQVGDAVRDAFGLRVGELVGGSIHRMHKDPQHVERVLAEEGGFSFPHVGDLAFGGVTLRANFDVLLDRRTGRRVGFVVSWRNVTELVEERARVAGLKEGLSTAGAAVEELNTAIASISSSAAQAADRAVTAVAGTRSMEEGIADLEQRRSEIDAAADAIDKVADQTRLLALNATIEAARAGEAGRGFAIVASEVKDLAASTAEVTADIGEKLALIGASIDALRSRSEQVVDDIENISGAQTSIAGAVEEQGAVAGDIGRSIGDALNGL